MPRYVDHDDDNDGNGDDCDDSGDDYDGNGNDDDHDGNDVDDDFAGQRRCPEIEGRGWASSPPGLSRLLKAIMPF